jgi:hypothetical protein
MKRTLTARCAANAAARVKCRSSLIWNARFIVLNVGEESSIIEAARL